MHALFNGREGILGLLESKLFPQKNKGGGFLNFDDSKLKISTYKQMPQRSPIALAQVKAGYNSENLLNEIRHKSGYYIYEL